jgi:hypothetical protein
VLGDTFAAPLPTSFGPCQRCVRPLRYYYDLDLLAAYVPLLVRCASWARPITAHRPEHRRAGLRGAVLAAGRGSGSNARERTRTSQRRGGMQGTGLHAGMPALLARPARRQARALERRADVCGGAGAASVAL